MAVMTGKILQVRHISRLIHIILQDNEKVKSIFISFSHPVNEIGAKAAFCRYNNDCIVFTTGSILSNITLGATND